MCFFPHFSIPECISLSKALEVILGSIADLEAEEAEELCDIDDHMDNADYHPPQQEPSSSEEESSGNEDPTPDSTAISRGCKHAHSESDSEPVVILLSLLHINSTVTICTVAHIYVKE